MDVGGREEEEKPSRGAAASYTCGVCVCVCGGELHKGRGSPPWRRALPEDERGAAAGEGLGSGALPSRCGGTEGERGRGAAGWDERPGSLPLPAPLTCAVPPRRAGVRRRAARRGAAGGSGAPARGRAAGRGACAGPGGRCVAGGWLARGGGW